MNVDPFASALWNKAHTKVTVGPEPPQDKISCEQFLTEEEIVLHLMDTMSPELVKELLTFNEEDVIAKCHSSFGRYVRNTYGLWNPKNPYTIRYVVDEDNSLVDVTDHPDNMSARIIERVHSYLKNGM